jgi:predicted nucleotidyltransferase component of viral defense system
VLTRAGESVVVDLIWERVVQAHPEKPEIAGIRVDPIEEILANTLTTVLSRSEERDLVDLFFLESDPGAEGSCLINAAPRGPC